LFYYPAVCSSAALLIAAVGACSSGLPAIDPATSYQCADGKSFDVIRTGEVAIVQLGDRTYNLQAGSGSLGKRYSNRLATLIIDGEFAALVTDNETELRSCRAQQLTTRKPAADK
jgi:hypothetical protein